MAEDEATIESGAVTAVAERPEAPVAVAEAPASHGRGKKRKKDEVEEPEYEVEFQTPFGKLEFELEPVTNKEKRDKQKREKAEIEAAKAAEKASKRAEKRLARAPAAGGRRGGSLLVVLVAFAIIAAAVAIAIWLFATPGAEEAEEVPPEYLQPGIEPAAERLGFADRRCLRIGNGVGAGSCASRVWQQTQERRFQDLTRGR